MLSRGTFDLTTHAYVEWEVEPKRSLNIILFGVVAEGYTDSAHQLIHQSDQAWMYSCRNLALIHAGRPTQWIPAGERPRQVERVGLLLQASRLYVYANGAQLTGGAMVGAGLPARCASRWG